MRPSYPIMRVEPAARWIAAGPGSGPTIGRDIEKRHDERPHGGGPGEPSLALPITVSGINEGYAILSSLSRLRRPATLIVAMVVQRYRQERAEGHLVEPWPTRRYCPGTAS
jgi:hypothetical protein